MRYGSSYLYRHSLPPGTSSEQMGEPGAPCHKGDQPQRNLLLRPESHLKYKPHAPGAFFSKGSVEIYAQHARQGKKRNENGPVFHPAGCNCQQNAAKQSIQSPCDCSHQDSEHSRQNQNGHIPYPPILCLLRLFLACLCLLFLRSLPAHLFLPSAALLPAFFMACILSLCGVYFISCTVTQKAAAKWEILFPLPQPDFFRLLRPCFDSRGLFSALRRFHRVLMQPSAGDTGSPPYSSQLW